MCQNSQLLFPTGLRSLETPTILSQQDHNVWNSSHSLQDHHVSNSQLLQTRTSISPTAPNKVTILLLHCSQHRVQFCNSQFFSQQDHNFATPNFSEHDQFCVSNCSQQDHEFATPIVLNRIKSCEPLYIVCNDPCFVHIHWNSLESHSPMITFSIVLYRSI